MFKKSKSYVLEHKNRFAIVLLILIALSYFGYTKFANSSESSKYVFGTAKKGLLIISVEGTGQVSPVNQIDLKPKASGDIIWLNAISGTKVAAGSIIAKLDTSDVSANVRDASISLESARLSYDKYKMQNSDDKLSANLIKSYDSGYGAVNSALVDIPQVLNNLEDLNVKDSLSRSSARIVGGNLAIDYYDNAETKFYIAQSAVNTLSKNYKGIERKSSNELIGQSLTETYKVSKLLSDAIKAKKDYVDYLYQESGRSNTYGVFQTSLGQYSTTINSHMSAALSAITNIQDASSAFGDTELGVQSSALSIKERQNSLRDAQDKLEDYIVRAPFAGLIAKSDAKLGDGATPSTVIATLITKQKLAEISLNEVDVSKVSIGQKATLTFDAIPDLTVSGEVSEIDLVGTESQGVVTYNVKISFDTQDDRVKPGMSVSSSIITETKSDVLLVPNSAVKTQSGSQYVEIYSSILADNAASSSKVDSSENQKTERVNVTIGLQNDEFTEIISGLEEGDRVITRKISSEVSASANKTTTSQVKFPGVGGMR